MPEHTIAENLTRLQNATTAIGNAITAKGGTVASGDGLEDFASDIASIPSGGGGSQPQKDINFYDYDGTIVNSYTAAEFANLSAMPSNPSHEGLTAQGWNWSLSDAKTYVASYGKLEIGQMYITSDGKTRLYIELTDGRLTPYLNLYLNANSELDIDWGDESAHSTFTTTSADHVSEMHTYASTGSYIIAITVVNGGFSLESGSNKLSTLLNNNNTSTTSPDLGYLNSIKRVEIGSSVTSIGDYAFRSCYSLTSITIPSSVTRIGYYTFAGCYSLTSITIPSSVTSIETSMLENCYSFTSITIPSSVTSIGNYVFRYSLSFASIIIPSSVTSIGDAAFYGCYSLTSITIPSSVTSIGYSVFSSCYSLATITINKAEGSISGSPWGAITSSPTSTQIIWTGE